MTQCNWQILLPSAVHLEERLTVSQSVSHSGKQEGRQKHTRFFFQWQTRLQAVGKTDTSEQAAVEWYNLGRRFKSRSADQGGGATDNSWSAGI